MLLGSVIIARTTIASNSITLQNKFIVISGLALIFKACLVIDCHGTYLMCDYLIEAKTEGYIFPKTSQAK